MTTAEFRTAFPAFKDAHEDDVQRHLNASTPFFNVARWGGYYAEGLGNWVAHRLVAEKKHGESQNDTALKGDVTSQTANGMSTSRSPEILKMAVLDRYESTTYGQEYRRLSRRVGMGIVVCG
jgi:hypothetical protein